MPLLAASCCNVSTLSRHRWQQKSMLLKKIERIILSKLKWRSKRGRERDRAQARTDDLQSMVARWCLCRSKSNFALEGTGMVNAGIFFGYLLYYLEPFGKFYIHLAYFVVNWYILSVLVCFT
jgi:hypothetical protein